MKRLFLTIFLAALVVPASAQTPQPDQPAAEPVYPIIRIGVVSFLQYDAELENRDGFNAFDLTRAYLNINGQLARNVRFRFTPDVRRVSDGALAGSLLVRVKYAFLQLDTPVSDGWLRFGLQQTPWLDFEQGIDRYRVQGSMFAEREGLIPGSGDFGASYFASLPGGYGEVHGGVFNGEGYAHNEVNRYKSVQTRMTVRPLPNKGIWNGLRLSGFYNAGWYAEHHPRRLGIVMGTFEHRNLIATVQRVDATENPSTTAGADVDRSGSSVFLEVRQGQAGWAGILRAEAFDPDNSLADNSHRRVIAGGAYWFVWPRSRVGLVVTNEQVHYDAGAARPTENRLLIQTHVEF